MVLGNLKDNFYCRIRSDCGNLSIEDWNERFKQAVALDIPEEDMEEFLEEKSCASQCVDCACIVGERRIETQQLLKGD